MHALLILTSGCVDAPPVATDSALDDPVEVTLDSAPGGFASHYIRAEPYDRLVVEIDYVEGHPPQGASLTRIAEVFEDLCDKPGGVEVTVDDVIPDTHEGPWTTEESANLELAWRDRYHDDEVGVASLYVLYLDDVSARTNDEGVVMAYVYHGASLILFPDVIAGATAGRPLTPADLEPTVVAHEIGHQLGLVGNGTPMLENHIDPGSPGHDIDADCLMYRTTGSDRVIEKLAKGERLDFDAACRADIAAVRDPR